eukprot:COSAG01_NODE_3650_length_5825_cov_7.891023_6_plen_150_part_00
MLPPSTTSTCLQQGVGRSPLAPRRLARGNHKSVSVEAVHGDSDPDPERDVTRESGALWLVLRPLYQLRARGKLVGTNNIEAATDGCVLRAACCVLRAACCVLGARNFHTDSFFHLDTLLHTHARWIIGAAGAACRSRVDAAPRVSAVSG